MPASTVCRSRRTPDGDGSAGPGRSGRVDSRKVTAVSSSGSGGGPAGSAGRAQEPLVAPLRGAGTGGAAAPASAATGPRPIGTAAASSASVVEAVPYERSAPILGRSGPGPGSAGELRTRERTASSRLRVSSRTAGASPPAPGPVPGAPSSS